MPVPALLRDLADWSWRILLLALTAYLTVRLLEILYFVVLPGVGALFAATLAYPFVAFLRRHGAPRALAVWAVALLAFAVLGVVLFLVVDRASAEYPQLVDQLSRSVAQAHSWLARHLHLRSSSFNNINTSIADYLANHRTAVASGALTGITTVSEAVAAFVLWFFMTFFFLYDGDNIWRWIVGLFPSRARLRVHRAGLQAWGRLAGFVRGTFYIAAFHALVLGVALTILGVPLVAPLALLIFVGSFLPLVGAVVFGGLAVVVALVTKGFVTAVVVVVVLVIDNQIEAHLLQPFLVGRYVRLHPLAVAVAIAGGSVLEGVYGAILAVPVLAVAHAVIRFLATGETEEAPRTGSRLRRTSRPAGTRAH